MHRVGRTLEFVGLGLGALAGAALTLHLRIGELPWIVTVGIVKSVFGSALALIATGAVMERIAKTERTDRTLPR